MIPAIQSLSEPDLREIAAALRSGRLSPPFSAAALQRYCSARNEAVVAREIQLLTEDGLKPTHLALMLESLAQVRVHRPETSDLIDLVWTGPETPGIVNRDTSVVVRELFSSAWSSVLVAGYAVFQGKEVFASLADRMDRVPGLKVQMFLNVHRKPNDPAQDAEIVQAFAHRFRTFDWPGTHLPEVYYDPRSLEPDPTKRSSLHAKCIVLDRHTAFVSSANFTEAAQERNIEVGALIRSPRFAARLADHFEALARASVLLPLPLR